MYKGKRYNVILVCLILVISLVVGTSMGMAFYGAPEAPPIDPNDNGGNFFEPVDSKQTFNGLKQPSSNASALARLQYALAVLDDGKGYTSTATYDIEVLGNNQYFFIKKYRSEEYDLVEEWYKMTGLASNLGLNYFVGALQTPDGVRQSVIHNSSQYSFVSFQNANYFPTEKNHNDMTIKQYTNSKFGVSINDFFAPINSSDSPVERYSKMPGKSYYEIRTKLNGDKLKPQFFSAFDGRGPVSIDIVELTCTFEIHKATGFLLKYKVEGQFDVSVYGTKGAAAYFSITENYLSMNTSALTEIKKIGKEKFMMEI